MITGIPSVDKGLNDVTDNLIETTKRNEDLKNKLLEELKHATRSEKEFIIFKNH